MLLLFLGNNQLEGALPESWAGLTQASHNSVKLVHLQPSRLQMLHVHPSKPMRLHGCQIVGLDYKLAVLQLRQLNISNNNLTGTLPEWMGVKQVSTTWHLKTFVYIPSIRRPKVIRTI